MSQDNNLQELLNNSEYEDQLIEMTKQYVLEFFPGIQSSPPFVITSTEKCFTLSEGNHVISGFNHKSADTHIALHCCKVGFDFVVVCKDTGVLILMIWSYSKLNITNN